MFDVQKKKRVNKATEKNNNLIKLIKNLIVQYYVLLARLKLTVNRGTRDLRC